MLQSLSDIAIEGITGGLDTVEPGNDDNLIKFELNVFFFKLCCNIIKHKFDKIMINIPRENSF